MVGVNMAFHGAICECFAGAMLEPCLLKPCFHVAGRTAPPRSAVRGEGRGSGFVFCLMCFTVCLHVYIYIYIYTNMCVYIYIYVLLVFVGVVWVSEAPGAVGGSN